MSIRALARELYGMEAASEVLSRIERLIATHEARPATVQWSENDVWLITYPDQFRRQGEAPLRTLDLFFREHLGDRLNGVHILPFYPWSSDDGFSVLDFEAVAPEYGTWTDVSAIAASGRLMVDAVINHMSAQSEWFRAFLAGEAPYTSFFRTADPSADLSATVRPRTHPLLTPIETANCTKHLWTTFSSDQIDLDYRSVDLLVRMIGVLLDYCRRGAAAIRLDAVGFLWKTEGTTSIHLRETHAVIQLIRAVIDQVYPDVILITETNVPHEENVSYLDGDESEAQAVYLFTLPPLVLHTLDGGDASDLSEWLGRIMKPIGDGRTYFTFLASHDGVGVRPLEGIVGEDVLDRLVELTVRAGGRVNFRSVSDDKAIPYELNSTWFSLMRAGRGDEEGVKRHLASHAIMLSLPGIAGLYVHSLFGGLNDQEGFARTQHNRSLNRRKFEDVDDLVARLADPGTREAAVFAGMRNLIGWRRSHPAFHPEAAMTVIDTPRAVFGVERGTG
ncbi:MAG: sugar phosphorylase, partial [Acidimicrobiia bacterium]|nr:sugar phosphorylase [Acidimicrobiia bacterium]